MTYSDADLLAYLSGRASESMADGIETALEQDPALEDRLMQLDPLGQTIGQSLDGLGADRVKLPAAKPRMQIWPMAISACLGAAVMAGIFLWPEGKTARPWMTQVAAYQALYSPATIAHVSTTQDGLATQFALLDAALGSELPLDALQSATDLDLRRAQVLAFDDLPLGQIVFADHAGRPVALCLIPAGATQRDIAALSLHGLNGATFTQGGFDYLVIGASSPQTALDLAAQFSQALPAG